MSVFQLTFTISRLIISLQNDLEQLSTEDLFGGPGLAYLVGQVLLFPLVDLTNMKRKNNA